MEHSEVITMNHVEIAEMINGAYYSSEGHLWQEGFFRINDEQIKTYLKHNELIFLSDNSALARVYPKDNNKCMAGLITVCQTKQGQGRGDVIVKEVVKRAKSLSMEKVCLEVLIAKDGHSHPHGIRLLNWYLKKGWQHIDTKNPVDVFPNNAGEKLVIECDLYILEGNTSNLQ
ncbi:MAG TPA: hypothetical protein EYG04_00940 [Candidatus Poseidoniales archaeon]|jgi:GNAT superfamily N-acetyltransferase|nr:hypothetical protein [Candidatus Poseidoniales archaeon]